MLLIRMVLLLTGLLMTVVPGACTRKDQRGDLNAEKRIRQIGIWFVAGAGIWGISPKIGSAGLWQQRSYGLLPQNFSENRL